jgi:glycosyltransferase involved in cell wall biosynthesis
MKIFSLAPKENWILDRIVKEWRELKPQYHTDNLNNANLLWIISPWLWRNIPAKFLIEKKVVVTIHHVVPEKFSKDSLREFLVRDKYVDCYHTPCQKTKDFISKMTKKPVEVIGYWYNSKIWSPTDKYKAREELKIPADAYVVGSFQRDTEGSDLISPKLEKGPDLFVETLKKINKDNLFVLLGGWRRQYIINRLEEENINFHFIEMAPLETLKDMYACCDLYIVASRVEGGPQAILEASAMKIPIISRDVGMATAVLNKNCVVDIPKNMYFPINNDINICYNNVKRYDMHNLVEEYAGLFTKTIGEQND